MLGSWEVWKLEGLEAIMLGSFENSKLSGLQAFQPPGLPSVSIS